MFKNKGTKWGLCIFMMLALIPLGITIMYLNRYSGINQLLRLYLSLILGSVGVAVFLLGCFFLKRQCKIGTIVMTVLSTAILIGSSYFAYVNMQIYRSLNQMITEQTIMHYSVVTMADNDIENISDLEGKRIATLNSGNQQSIAHIEQYLKENNLLDETTFNAYDSPLAMVQSLYDGEIDAMIIGSNFNVLLSERRGFEEIETETQVLDVIEVVTQQTGPRDSTYSIVEEPFSMLLLGVDTVEDGLATPGQVDAIILATINPLNLSITMTSIPRDSYVEVPCFNYLGDKLAHASHGGVTCVVQTIEHMFDMEIPYYVMVNFRAVVELVDTLGGITVDVPQAFQEQNSRRQFGRHLIRVEEGVQRLDGEQALAMTRHRRTLREGDLGRARNQQLVFEAILNEMLREMNTVNEFLVLLNVLGQNIETNLSINDMTTGVQHLFELVPTFQGNNPVDYIHIKNMVLSGQFGRTMTRHYSFPLSVIFPFAGAIADAREAMAINLGLQAPSFTHSFSFDGFGVVQRRNWVQPSYPEFFPDVQAPIEPDINIEPPVQEPEYPQQPVEPTPPPVDPTPPPVDPTPPPVDPTPPPVDPTPPPVPEDPEENEASVGGGQETDPQSG